ncbi:MAG: RraA family protein [Trueperaceae bacterium]|nr:RraA family protein [Trueperaceae bacterium]
MEWHTDAELFELIEGELFTAVIGDTLDANGYRHQFLPPRIRGLKNYGVVAGRAMPALEADVFDDREPFGKMLDALDSLESGGSTSRPAERLATRSSVVSMSIAARARGARAAILCGFHRDSRELLENSFPVFSYGAYAQDQQVRGRVIDYRVPIEIEGVAVAPGDIIVADLDGVVVLPADAETRIVYDALRKVRTESEVRRELERGMLAKDAFDEFGVL